MAQARSIQCKTAFFLGILAFAGVAHAETLHVSGLYPAPYRDASLVESIMVETFSGNEGPGLSHEIERQLVQATVDGQPWFDIVARGARQPSVARMTGVANVGLDEQFFKEMRKECVERDASDKCLREEERPVRCTRRVINLTTSIRIARVDDGHLVYSVQKPKRDETSFCPDRGTASTPDEVVDRLVKDVARAVRNDISPFFSTDKIKVLEDRKGMPKDVAERFKMAVKYSKKSPDMACTLFSELNQQSPSWGPVAYDVALCAEMNGRLDEAEALYLKAQPLMARDTLVSQGLQRVTSRRVANADWAERKARRGN